MNEVEVEHFEGLSHDARLHDLFLQQVTVYRLSSMRTGIPHVQHESTLEDVERYLSRLRFKRDADGA